LTPDTVGETSATSLPLCVDLDGTLLRTDTLEEAAAAVVLRDWRAAIALPAWLLSGKARLKEELGRRWEFDPALLPARTEFVEWLAAERRDGRRLILATAADRAIAEKVAAHFGLFDEVIASHDGRNLRGPAKAEALVERFGPRGFAYAGNDRTDLSVWQHAGEAIVVGGGERLQREAAAVAPVVATFPAGTLPWAGLLRGLRPHQWVKNLLCFVPLLASGSLDDLRGWALSALIAIAFSCVASAIYLVNDLGDLAADRAHPRKRRRPLASGALSIPHALAAAAGLAVAGLAIGHAAGGLALLLLYAAASLAYSTWLKERPLVDVFLLAVLYCLRIAAGGEASAHPISLWLLGFASFLFLSLALVKRTSELLDVQARGLEAAPKRGYLTRDLPVLVCFGVAASFAAAIILSLYLQSKAAMAIYDRTAALWAGVPLMLFWQARLWLATWRGYMHDDPIVYSARDWVSWLVAAAGFIALLIARGPF